MNNFEKSVYNKAYRIVKKLDIPFCPFVKPFKAGDMPFSRAVALVVESCIDMQKEEFYDWWEDEL